jgi:glycosyltransferase involved in cell wall biosynthesis
MTVRPDVLLFAPTPFGGLAEHSFYQGRALQKSGAKVLCLASRKYLDGRPCEFRVHRVLAVPPPLGGSRWLRRLKGGLVMLANQFVFAWWMIRYRPRLALLDSYAEYLSPFWVWPHLVLARGLGLKYAANLHDPVRNLRLGPRWWHELSIRMAYWPLDFVLVHNALAEPSPVPPDVKVCEVPHGVYDLPAVAGSREHVRESWGAQPEHRVFLSFGYVRNGKNLDLAIRALREVPGAFLVIAGSVASGRERPFSFYRELAVEHQVVDRVRFFEGFVSDSALGNYFAGADCVLLTYSSKFHSQSGVLNIAGRARKPVLASASPSPLIETVHRFKLGVTVPPDSAATIAEGMRQMLSEKLDPLWEEYEAFASWDANAKGVLRTAGLFFVEEKRW